MKSLVAPVEPSKKTLEELLAALRNHLSPKPSVIAERATFHKRQQHESETIAEYVAELKRLAET